MPGNLFIAIGTHRSAAEDWIATLPDRFPNLKIQTLRKEQLYSLTDQDDACAVLAEPVVDITELDTISRRATELNWQVWIQYFPAETLFTLIQRDMQQGSAVHGGAVLGAPALKEELKALQPVQVYEQLLDSETAA